MPELPEVEIVRAQLAQVLDGRTIREVRVLTGWPPIQTGFDRFLVGKRVKRVLRHGKRLFLVIEGDRVVMSHLGMSGSYRISKSYQRKTKDHEHFGLKTWDNWVYYKDPRRFGQLVMLESKDIPEITGDDPASAYFGVARFNQGIDALDLRLMRGDKKSAKTWEEQLQLCSPGATAKAMLMDQSCIAGIGNIYASEILHHCFIHPQRQVNDLSRDDIKNLAYYTPQILVWAINTGGATIPGGNPYVDTVNRQGQVFEGLRVYGKEGRKCKTCRKERIRKLKQDGRSSFYCPRCQRA